MIELCDITFSTGEKDLVQNVSLSIQPGQITALIGPNGAGKTTLLGVASGEQKPTQGSLFFDGTPMARTSCLEMARLKAVVAQSSSLSFPFPVFEVVLLGRMPHLRVRESPHDMDIAWQAMRAVGIDHLAKQAYTTLSGGERQRVHIARALAQIWESPTGDKNRYLFLDEPTASLDLANQHDILRLVQDLARKGVGILIVLHDLNLAAQYADNVVILQNGRCIACGKPEEVLKPALIEEAFALKVLVEPHPCHNCPLIVPIASAAPKRVNGIA